MNLANIFPLIPLGWNEYNNLIPLFALAFGALIALLVGTNKEKGHFYAFVASMSTLGYALFHQASQVFGQPTVILGGTLVYDQFTRTMSLMILSFALVATVLSYGQDKKENLLSEMYGLILFATAGMILMVSTNHLMFMFIALEIMSLAIYVLVSMRRSSRFSSEAGMKYFILGGLASAFFLYGTSLIFGATSSFDLGTINGIVRSQVAPSFIFYIGLGLVTVAMLFKVGAFPFQGWVPDVYQGASTNITGFMGAAVKFTAFMAFAKITQFLVFADGVKGLEWFKNFIWLASAASMIYGNFVAISQVELKRMLAFSTIAHTGYLLLGLSVQNTPFVASDSILLYLFFYGLANLGAFAVIAQFEEKNQKDLTLNQIAGLGFKYPMLSLFLTIFLLSMAGIPLTSGFIGKYGLFSSAVNGGEVPLVVIAVLTSVVSVYYYLRVIVYLFMKESTSELATYQNLNGATLAAAFSALATLQFGLFPRAIISIIRLITR